MYKHKDYSRIMKEFKVGDKLMCINECHRTDNFCKQVIVAKDGKVYKIHRVYRGGVFEITDELGYLESFHMGNYWRYFVTLSELRKRKLERIGNVG